MSEKKERIVPLLKNDTGKKLSIQAAKLVEEHSMLKENMNTAIKEVVHNYVHTYLFPGKKKKDYTKPKQIAKVLTLIMQHENYNYISLTASGTDISLKNTRSEGERHNYMMIQTRIPKYFNQESISVYLAALALIIKEKELNDLVNEINKIITIKSADALMTVKERNEGLKIVIRQTDY